MSNLRSALIRLANTNPDLRSSLLPLLAEGTSRVAADYDQLTDLGKQEERTAFLAQLKASGWQLLNTTASNTAAKELSKMGCRNTNPEAVKKYGGTTVLVEYVNARAITYYPVGRGKCNPITYGRAQPDSVVANLASASRALKKAADIKGIPVSGTDIRSAYYKSGDGVGALVDAVANEPATKDDAKLKKAVADLDKAHTAVFNALKPYNWD